MNKYVLIVLSVFSAAINASATNTQGVPGIGTSASPSLSVCNGGVWMAWKGQGSDTAIYVPPTYTGLKPAMTPGQTDGPYGGSATNPVYYLFTPQMKVSSVTSVPGGAVPGGTVPARVGAPPIGDSKPISVVTPST